MHKLMTPILILIISFAVAAGCATRRETGAVTGAAAGTAAGAAIGDTEGAIIGGLLGTIVGHEVGRYMDRQDRQQTRNALENNRTGETSDWINPDTGRRYRVTPQDTYTGAGEQPCREFVIESSTHGATTRTIETACRQSDGTWKIRN